MVHTLVNAMFECLELRQLRPFGIARCRWPEPSMCGADTKAWEVDTLRGHVNNVSCVMFHARQVGFSLKDGKVADSDSNCQSSGQP